MSIKRLFFDDYGPRVGGFMVALLLLLASIGAGLGVLARHLDAVSCRNQAALMHREYRSQLVGGCLVRLDDGTFIPIGNLHANDVERHR